MMTEQNGFKVPRVFEDRDLFQRLFDRPIAFHRCFAEVSGSALSGLMLSQAIYWATRDTTIARDGWFYKTQDQWYEETFMTRSEQETARRRLRQKGFIEEERRGVPAKLYYRVCLEELERALLPSVQNCAVSKDSCLGVQDDLAL